VADRAPFFPGTGSAHLGETLQATAAAEALGADAVLVITPYYSRPTQQALFDWYSTIAREFPSLPIVVYNVPVRTAVDIHPETVGRLRRAHANVVGIKETTRDFEHASYVIDECGRDFLVYCGIELLCYPMLAIGGAGHLSCVANVAPKPCAALYDAFAAGDHDEAVRLHYELHPLVEMAFVETNPGPVKWAMERLGILESGGVRPPLASPSPASRERIEALLAGVGLLEPSPAGS
jgi:4-hydroxy-tetrahydrodipicolinate synthase